jgi:hypothetical protein
MNISEAYEHAIQAHHGQLDKVGRPSLLHSHRVSQHFIREIKHDAAVVAILHDVLEDCPGYEIPGIDSDTLLVASRGELTTTQRQALCAITQGYFGEETYFEYIGRCRENRIARMIKVIDIEDNMSPIRTNGLPVAGVLSMRQRYTRALEILLEHSVALTD